MPGKEVWATESLLVDVVVHARFVVLKGCFHAYATGTESRNERRLGPFATAANAEAARVAICEVLGLPRVPIRVSEEDLRAEPNRFDGAHVEVIGDWIRGLERSRFAGAWLIPPTDDGLPSRRIKACGFWHAGTEGYGHLGASPAELVAYEVVDIPPPLERPKGFQLDGVSITFERNGERDEWCVCANGARLAARYNGVAAEWMPLGPCLRAPEPFQLLHSDDGDCALCVWSRGHADVQGTAVYLMESIRIRFNDDATAVVVDWSDCSDTSA